MKLPIIVFMLLVVTTYSYAVGPPIDIPDIDPRGLEHIKTPIYIDKVPKEITTRFGQVGGNGSAIVHWELIETVGDVGQSYLDVRVKVDRAVQLTNENFGLKFVVETGEGVDEFGAKVYTSKKVKGQDFSTWQDLDLNDPNLLLKPNQEYTFRFWATKVNNLGIQQIDAIPTIAGLDLPLDWFNTTYRSRRIINITNLNGTSALTNFTFNFSIDTSELVANGMSNDCSDIRFVNTTNFILFHHIQRGCPLVDSVINVLVPGEIPAGENYIVEMYFDSDQPVQNFDDRFNSFFFYTDGDDVAGWNVTSGPGTVTNETGFLSFNSSGEAGQTLWQRNFPTYTTFAGNKLWLYESVFTDFETAPTQTMNQFVVESSLSERIAQITTRDDGVNDNIIGVAGGAFALVDPFVQGTFYVSNIKIDFTANLSDYVLFINGTKQTLGLVNNRVFTVPPATQIENIIISDEATDHTDSIFAYMLVRSFDRAGFSFAVGPIENNAGVNIVILNPTNSSFFISNNTIETNWFPSGNLTSYACTETAGTRTTFNGNVTNNTVQSNNISYSPGFNNFSVLCIGFKGNETADVFFSIVQPEVVDCSVPFSETILNLTLRNANTREQELGDIDIVIDSWVNKDNITNTTFTFTNTTSEIICVSPAGSTLNVNASIQYGNIPVFPERDFFIVNEVVNVGSPSFFDLYMLPANVSTAANIRVNDKAGVGQDGIIIEVQRFFFDINEWITMTIVQTGFDGSSLTNLVDSAAEDIAVNYRFALFRDGEPIKTVTQGKLSADPTTGEIEVDINLDIDVGKAFEIFDSVLITCFNDTSTIFCNYSDLSGTLSFINLTVSQKPQTAFTFTEICTNQSTASTGVLNCSIGASPNGTFTFQVFADFEGATQTVKSGSFEYLVIFTLGTIGLLITAMIVMSFSFLMRNLGAAAIILSSLVGLILSAIFGALVIDFAVFSGIIIIGLVIVFIMRDA